MIDFATLPPFVELTPDGRRLGSIQFQWWSQYGDTSQRIVCIRFVLTAVRNLMFSTTWPHFSTSFEVFNFASWQGAHTISKHSTPVASQVGNIFEFGQCGRSRNSSDLSDLIKQQSKHQRKLNFIFMSFASCGSSCYGPFLTTITHPWQIKWCNSCRNYCVLVSTDIWFFLQIVPYHDFHIQCH